jgi:hypothetical protein
MFIIDRKIRICFNTVMSANLHFLLLGVIIDPGVLLGYSALGFSTHSETLCVVLE